MQFSNSLSSLEEMYQITRSFLCSHKRFYPLNDLCVQRHGSTDGSDGQSMHHFGADWKVSTPLCRRSCSQDDRSQWLSLTYPLVSQHSVTFLVLFQKSLHQSIYLWVNDLWEKKNQIGSYTDTVIAVSQNCSKNVITEITLKNNVVILVKVCTRRACCVTSGGCDVLWLVGWGISVAPHCFIYEFVVMT